jgi:hypothetical protein
MTVSSILSLSAYASNSIWSSSAVPATASVADNNALELGVKFRSDVNGYITGVRFYKGSTNTGTHVGHLWASTGTLLATATFTNEAASGWQQVMFSSPVAITANAVYVASYYAPQGNFALDRPYFTTGTDNAPLHALADGVSGSNGVYFYPGSGFPTSSYQQSNYWVDVVFSSSSSTGSSSTQSPAVTIGNVTPNSVPTAGGTVLAVSGSNFQSGASVNLGGTNCTAVTYISASQLNVMAPAHAARTVNLAVTNPDGTSATISGAITYSASATVSSVSPSSGPTSGGTAVSIFGTGFQSGAVVSFGAVLATSVSVISSTQIEAIAPASQAGTVNVAVQVPSAGTASLNSAFTFFPSASAPTITSVSPVAGAAGTVVTISGTNFVSGAIVNFGSTAATSVTVLNATQINATAPNGTAGTKANITVINPNGLSVSLAGGFFFGQGLLTGMTPAHFSVPAGWTLVQAVDFENGTPGSGATLANMSVVSNFGHTGTHAVRGSYTQGDSTVAWHSADLSGSRDTYISFWEYDDSTGTLQTDFDIGWIVVPNQTDAIIRFQPGCGGHNRANAQDIPYTWNALVEQPILYVEGVSRTPYPNFATWGWGTECLSPNVLSNGSQGWGNWTQWEIRVKENDPASTSSAANGEVELYQNGVLVNQISQYQGQCSGNPAPCSNLAGNLNVAAMPHNAQVGGVYTKYAEYMDSALSQCATIPNVAQYARILGSFSNPDPCPNQAPTTGYVPIFNRYFDDIIILKK